MQEFNDFKKVVTERIQDRCGKESMVQTSVVMKNNGVERTSLTVRREGYSCEPCVYLEDYFDLYERKSKEIEEIVDIIMEAIDSSRELADCVDLHSLMDWESVKGYVVAKLVNAKENREYLTKVPHREFLDLAVVYHIRIKKVDGVNDGSFPVEYHHLKTWGKDEDILYRKALSNMYSDGGAVLENLQEVLAECGMEMPDIGKRNVPEMYVLTNASKRFGAVEIIDRNNLRKAAEKMGGDLVLIPSSVHEVLLLKREDVDDIDQISRMVREVNDTSVEREDILSDHVYLYDRESEELSITA